MANEQPPTTTYTMGHSKATTASHEARTIESDASFVLPYIQPNHHILDVGCGPGTITLGFAALVPTGSVTGVDYSQDIISRAKALATEKGMDGKVAFKQASVLDRLPFADESFDIVFASQLFGHLQPAENAVRALSECRRVLRTGGLLAVRDAAFMHFYPFSEELRELWTLNLFRGVGSTQFGGPQMRGWLRKAGFDVDDPEKARFGGGANVCATRGECERFRDAMVGRLARGEGFRESWVKVGVCEEECDRCVEYLEKWAASEEAWYGVMQTETVVWK